MVFFMVIYATLINLTEMECILLLLYGFLSLCLCVLGYSTFNKSK